MKCTYVNKIIEKSIKDINNFSTNEFIKQV